MKRSSTKVIRLKVYTSPKQIAHGDGMSWRGEVYRGFPACEPSSVSKSKTSLVFTDIMHFENYCNGGSKSSFMSFLYSSIHFND